MDDTTICLLAKVAMAIDWALPVRTAFYVIYNLLASNATIDVINNNLQTLVTSTDNYMATSIYNDFVFLMPQNYAINYSLNVVGMFVEAYNNIIYIRESAMQKMNNELCTGVSIVDEEHTRLNSRIYNFANTITSIKNMPCSYMLEQYKTFLNNVQSHFKCEENILIEINKDEADLLQQEHDKLLTLLDESSAAFIVDPLAVIEYVKTLLRNHIMQCDSIFKKYSEISIAV